MAADRTGWQCEPRETEPCKSLFLHMAILHNLGTAVGVSGFRENRSDDLKSDVLSSPVRSGSECEGIASIRWDNKW